MKRHSTDPESRTLWDVEDAGRAMPKVRDMAVGPVSRQDAAEFCARYHYTGVGNNLTWRWGLWDGPVLLGVVTYNLPTRETCESVFGPEHHEHVWHMGRLVLPDAAPRNSESRLIAGSLRLIRRDHPHVWGVLTYAATDVGHLGYVYQATNAIYTGTGGHATYYIDQRGHRRGAYLGGAFVGATRAVELGWTRQEGGPKHRYLYVIGTKSERRARMRHLLLTSLPYPKGVIGEAVS